VEPEILERRVCADALTCAEPFDANDLAVRLLFDDDDEED